MSPAHRARARAHITELARQHRIRVRRTRRWKSEAHASTRQVWVPRAMRDPIDYLVALHEIAHVVLQHGYDDTVPLRRVLCYEAQAWAWVVEHADPVLLRQVTVRDWRQLGTALTSFLRAAAQDRSVTKR